MDTKNETAEELLAQGGFEASLLIYKELYDYQNESLGSDHVDTLITESKIAIVLGMQGEYDEAIQMHTENYPKLCHGLGSDHPNAEAACRSILEIFHKLSNHGENTCCFFANLFQEQGKYDEAYEVCRTSARSVHHQCDMARKIWGRRDYDNGANVLNKVMEFITGQWDPYHITTLNIKHDIGMLMFEAERREEAEEIAREIDDKRKYVSGVRNPLDYKRLGYLNYVLGNCDEALEIYLEAYERMKNTLGPEHYETFTIQLEVAFSLSMVGRNKEALSFVDNLLQYQENMDPKYPNIWETKKRRAEILQKLKEYDAAFKGYNEVYNELNNKNPDDLETLVVQYEMAIVLDVQNKYTEALEVYREVYRKRSHVLGTDHSDTLKTLVDIGVTTLNLGQYDNALDDFKTVFERRKALYGIEDSSTLVVRDFMAEAFARQKKYLEALSVYREIYEVRKTLSFSDETLFAVTNLANMLCILGKYEESLRVYEDIYTLRKANPDALNTLGNKKDIITVLVESKRDDIENAFEELAKESLNILGPQHPVTLNVHDIVAEIFSMQDKYEEMIKAKEKVYKLQIEISYLGPNHIETLGTKNDIGFAYSKLKEHDKALKLFKEIYETIESLLGPEHSNSLDVRASIASTLTEQGKYVEAQHHYIEIYKKRLELFGSDDGDLPELMDFLKFLSTKIPQTKLEFAVVSDDFEAVSDCMEKYCNVNQRDVLGDTLLHIVSKQGSEKIARLLLASGAFYDAPDLNGKTPLEVASYKTRHLFLTLDALFDSVKKGHQDSVAECFEELDASINIKDSKGNTVLHWAAAQGNVDIVNMILDKSADPHVINAEGETPKHVAIREGHTVIVEILKLRSQTEAYSLSNLIDNTKGYTPLHFSACSGNVEILKAILSSGGDPTITSNSDYTPLHIAAYKGNTDMVKALLEHVKRTNKKKLKNFVNFRNKGDGTAAIHIASKKGYCEIVKLLLRYGANAHLGTIAVSTKVK